MINAAALTEQAADELAAGRRAGRALADLLPTLEPRALRRSVFRAAPSAGACAYHYANALVMSVLALAMGIREKSF